MRDRDAGLGPDAMLGDKPVRAAGERAGRPSGIRRIHLRRIRRIDVASVGRSDSRNLHEHGLGARASKVIPPPGSEYTLPGGRLFNAFASNRSP